MEFFDLGKHCHFCQQQDFLPFECEFCSLSFCSEHRYAVQHECKKYTTKIQTRVQSKPSITPKMSTCHHKRCKEFTVTTCKECNNSFCSSHRLIDFHDCKKQDIVNNSTSRVFDITKIKDFQLRKAIEAEVKGKKLREEFGFHRTYDIKPEIKKRKNDENFSFSNTHDTSFGNQNVEQEDRFYFKVFFPKESKLQPIHHFFTKSRSIGKIIDLLAQQAKIKKRISSIQDPARLNIYKFTNGVPLKANKTLLELEREGIIKSGDLIILERGILDQTLDIKEYCELFGTSKFDAKDKFKQTSTPKNHSISVK